MTTAVCHSAAHSYLLPIVRVPHTEEGSYLDKFFKEAKGKGREEVGAIMERATDISVAHEEAANEGQTRVGLVCVSKLSIYQSLSPIVNPYM